MTQDNRRRSCARLRCRDNGVQHAVHHARASLGARAHGEGFHRVASTPRAAELRVSGRARRPISPAIAEECGGIDIIHIPYKGAAPALTDLLAAMWRCFSTTLTALAQVKGGKARALAVTTARRSKAAPDCPRWRGGVPNVEVGSCVRAARAAGTPKDVVARLHTETAYSCDTGGALASRSRRS